MEDEERLLLERFSNALKLSKQHPIFFIESFCHLKDQKIGEPIPFVLWDCQKEQIQDWLGYKESITLKTRQIGISWLSGAFGLWCCYFNNYFETMVISKKEEDAVEYLSRVKFMFDNMHPLIQQVNPITNQNRLKLEFGNGARFIAESSNPQAGRSRTLNLLIFDEASFMPDARSIDTAASPTLEKTGGKKIIISTANGYDDYFQPKWNAAINNMTDTKALFIPWSGDPTHDQEWWNKGYSKAKAEDNGPLWLQEHPRTHIEAFITTGNTVFDPELVNELTLELKKKNIQPKHFYFNSKSQIIRDNAGKIHLYSKPIQNTKYVLGADVAEGLSKGDYSTAVIYPREPTKGIFTQVLEYRDHVDTDTFAKNIESLAKYYNHATINLEMNSYGESVMNTLQKKLHYPKFYHQMRYDESSKRKIKKLGWKTTATSKPILIDTLKALTRDRSMSILSLATLSEMKTYVRHDKGLSSSMGASYGAYDDLLIAHALCSIVLLEKPVVQKRTPFKSFSSNIQSKPAYKRRTYDVKKVFK